MLNKLLSLLLLLSVLTLNTHSQTVKVVDKVNLDALEDVYIFAGDKYVVTNEYGMAEISKFMHSDTIIIQHKDYNSYKSTFEQLENSDFLIRLSPNIIHVDEIIVSANKSEQSIQEVPNKIVSIDKKNIEFYNPQTAADLLKISDEVFVQKSQLGGGSPMIRGYAANRVLLVVDGVRMNNAIFRSGNLQNVISLDAHAVENTEIIFGPGSVVYGSDAIGGVLSFKTLNANISGSEKHNHSLNALTRYATANKEKTGHIDFNLGSEKTAFRTSLSYSDYDDLRMGSKKHEAYRRVHYADRPYRADRMKENENPNIQKYSGYSQINFMQKIRFVPNQNTDISYAFHISSTSDIPRYDRLIQYEGDSLKYAQWYYGPQKWQMHSLNFLYDKANPLFDAVHITAAGQIFNESRHDRKFGQETIRERFEQVNALTLNADFQKHLKPRIKFFYGVELLKNKVFSKGQIRNISNRSKTEYASRYPDNSDFAAAAGYISANWLINEKTNISAGLRYNYGYLYAPFDTSFYNFPFNHIENHTQALTGSLGLTQKIGENTRIITNLSTGFRTPNIDDSGKIFDSEPGNVIVPNPDLKPEYAYNADWGITQQIADRLQLRLTAFGSLLNNALVRSPFTFNGRDTIIYDGEPSRVQALVNADRARIYGAHLNIKINLSERLAFQANYNHSRGQDSQGNALRHVSPDFAAAHLLFTAKQFKADFYAVWNDKIPYANLAESERSKTHMYATDQDGNPYSPAWYTLNISGSWQINPKLKLNMAAENLLDHRYRPYSSGIVAPGRNFIISLKLAL